MAIKDIIVFFVETAIMLILAITDAILALACGDLSGVAKAIEFGLSKLIVLVIGLFAKLIGLGGLADKVKKIFKKIRKRVDTAIKKLLKKAKAAGRKIMRKLGLGKDKPKNKEQHDQQVKAGLQYLTQQTTSVDKDGDKKLTQEEANNAAAKTKSKFKVFKSITPKEQGGNWVFDWTGSKGTKKTDKKTYELSADVKDLIKKLNKLPASKGAGGLVGYLESKKILPWFKHGFKTQAERALYYNAQKPDMLVSIEFAFKGSSKNMSRFDLVIRNPETNHSGKDNGDRVVVEVKNWTGFVTLDAVT